MNLATKWPAANHSAIMAFKLADKQKVSIAIVISFVFFVSELVGKSCLDERINPAKN